MVGLTLISVSNCFAEKRTPAGVFVGHVFGSREDRPESTGNSRLGPREDRTLSSGGMDLVFEGSVFGVQGIGSFF